MERDTNSNVNFIHVVWRNIEAQYAFRRHAITILPDQDGFTIRLPRIPQYDVPIGGWTFSYGCTICSGVDRDQVHPLTDCIPPAEACSFNICIRRPLSLKTLFSMPTLPCCAIPSNSGWRSSLLIQSTVLHAAWVASILSSGSLPNFLPSHSCIPSRPVRAVLVTLHVPPNKHRFAPRQVNLSLARKRSRLCAQTETSVGVVSVTSYCFLSRLPVSRATGGRCPWLYSKLRPLPYSKY